MKNPNTKSWNFLLPEVLEEVAIKPGETIFSAWSDAEIEAFDSKFDSNALPGSALTEVALDPEFLKIRKILAQVELQLYMGPFNNYVDKRVSKASGFVHAHGMKTVHAGEGGQKMAKFCLRNC